jgi:glycosyltransferase 2 family protein
MNIESASPDSTEKKRAESGKLPRFLRLALGYIFTAACLFWVFHDIHADILFKQMASLKWGWLFLAMFFDLLAYIGQAIRWRLLLRPLGKLSLLKVAQAIYTGLFLNEILPLRPGEVARVYLVSRWLKTDFVSVIPSAATERLFDAIWLVIGIGLTAFFVQLPRDIMDSTKILGMVVLAVIIIFLVLIIRKQKSLERVNSMGKSSLKIISPLRSFLGRIASGINEIGVTRYFYLALSVSALPIICQILAIWLAMQAYSLDLSIWVGAAVLLIVVLGNAIPNAPSNVGAYQFFMVVGLSLFGVDKPTATGFSVIVFIALSLPFWIIGMIAINLTGIKFTDLRNEVSKLLTWKTGSKGGAL